MPLGNRCSKKGKLMIFGGGSLLNSKCQYKHQLVIVGRKIVRWLMLSLLTVTIMLVHSVGAWEYEDFITNPYHVDSNWKQIQEPSDVQEGVVLLILLQIRIETFGSIFNKSGAVNNTKIPILGNITFVNRPTVSYYLEITTVNSSGYFGRFIKSEELSLETTENITTEEGNLTNVWFYRAKADDKENDELWTERALRRNDPASGVTAQYFPDKNYYVETREDGIKGERLWIAANVGVLDAYEGFNVSVFDSSNNEIRVHLKIILGVYKTFLQVGTGHNGLEFEDLLYIIGIGVFIAMGGVISAVVILFVRKKQARYDSQAISENRSTR